MKVSAFGFLLLFVLSSSCTERTRRLDKFPDPYAESFRGKGLKIMVSYNEGDSSSIRERIEFDKMGNIQQVKAIFVNERMSYDSLGFISRKLSRGEQYSNFWITYSFDEDGDLIQTWNALSHYNWDFDSTQINKLDSANHSVKFKIDEKRRIVKEIDEFLGTYAHYSYNESGLLTSKRVFSIESDSLRENWNYTYEGKKLGEIKYYFGNRLIFTHLFSQDGLIDLSILDNKSRIRYKYLY